MEHAWTSHRTYIAAGVENGFLCYFALQFNRVVALGANISEWETFHLQLFISLVDSFHFVFHSSDFFSVLHCIAPRLSVIFTLNLGWISPGNTMEALKSTPALDLVDSLQSRVIIWLHFFFYSFPFFHFPLKNSTFHFILSVKSLWAAAAVTTSHTNWKCFQNGILLLIFSLYSEHSLHLHLTLTLTSPFPTIAMVFACMQTIPTINIIISTKTLLSALWRSFYFSCYCSSSSWNPQTEKRATTTRAMLNDEDLPAQLGRIQRLNNSQWENLGKIMLH